MICSIREPCLRLLLLLLLQQLVKNIEGTSLSNPCTPEALQQKRFYHAYPLDRSSYVQCTEWGTPIIRRCPSSQVWSTQYVTCVDAAAAAGPSGPPGNPGAQPAQPPQAQTSQAPSTTVGQLHPGPVNGAAGSGEGFLPPGLSPDVPGGVPNPGATGGSVASFPRPAGYYKSYWETAAWGAWLSGQPLGTGTPGSVGPGSPAGTTNPCSQPNARYFPNPTNPNGYYECVSGQLAERLCPSDQVWNQERAACVARMTVPTGSPSSTSPCSAAGFVAFPGDPTKYIVCFDAVRYQVLSCPAGQIWSSQTQSCSSGAQTVVPVQPAASTTSSPGSVPTGSPSGSGGANGTTLVVCSQDRSSYYHAYPPDTSRFIQCDEFDNAYLRYCGPNKTWNDAVKTCVGSNVVGSSTSTGAATGAAAAGAGGGTGVPSGSGAIGGSIAGSAGGVAGVPSRSGVPGGPAAGSSAGGPAAAGNESSVVVGGGVVSGIGSGSIGTGMNFPVGGGIGSGSNYFGSVAIGGNIETIIVTEIFRILCPYGYRYDVQAGVCALSADSVNVGVFCPPGFTWNITLNLCLQSASPPFDGSGGLIFPFPVPGAGAPAGGSFPPATPSAGGGGSAGLTSQPTPGGGGFGGATAQPQPPRTPGASLPSGSNPCGTSPGFYFQYPSSRSFFIQCDAIGNAFVQPCPSGLEWSQDLLTCIHPVGISDILFPSSNTTNLAGNESGISINSEYGFGNGSLSDFPGSSRGNLPVDPCSTAPNGSYLLHPTNPAAFLQCNNKMSNVRFCPQRMVWDQSVMSCVVR